jgi:uncharacterized protein (TIGR03435 family)
VAGAFGILIVARAPAQSPTFDAVSVKPAGPFVPGSMGMRGGPGTNDPGRIISTYVMLKNVLMKAYDLRPDQISGPAWMDDYSIGDSNFFSITATMPPSTTPERFRLMLQNLLAERFHLAVHHETREFPGYELVVASGGPKLREAAPEDGGAARRPVERFDANGFPIRRLGDSSFTSLPRPGTWGIIRSSNRVSMAKSPKLSARW